ncbi:hypothetical protein R69608_02145 [Paraburkholderia nemoris]|uniref:hypothetical protein n=1 Tax=Paraburkholderia nemoris TaxID=2793076 RepID=UPI00190E36EB|nr:hypothetical protein [Paraburkholderia nemoris]MBK3744974.1 hypothetical protein [Paraburkholderia aspalathi]MBK5153531.1 hypothetical protein [Burkholderia sp. R-69608]CAE6705717.1 hypothetical protein R69619_00869 [Paraburkholderia nemoris]CAE6887311.1 hypothetical protein R69608_02145 [Paraburkholderia nemoris]
MRSSGLRVRRFSSAAQERAFRWDYARRFSGQRRLAITIFTALWVVTGELLSDHVLRDFPEPFVLLRKSSAPKDLLAEISRYVSAQRTMTVHTSFADDC